MADDKVKDIPEETPATSAEGKAEEEEAKGFTTPDDGEPIPEDGGKEGSKEDEASAPPEEKEEKKDDEPTGEEKEAGEKTPEEQGEKTTEDAAGESGDEEDEDKVPKGVKKRIGRAVKAQHDAEREASRLQGVIDGMNAKQPSAPEDETTPEEVARPVQEDFETEEAYIEALTDFKVDQKFVTRDAKNAEKATADQEATATAARQEGFQKKIDKAAGDHEDYNEVTFRNPNLAVTKPMLRECEELKNGAEVVYYLGKNQAEAEKIARLPQKAMERALWGIEEGLKPSAPAPKADTKKVPGAPDPIEAPSGGGGGGGKIDHENESIEDFMKRENEKDLKAHGYR